MRDATPYAARRQWVAPAGYGLNVSEPQAGFYRMRMRAESHFVGVRVWFGAPKDPVTGEELDRSLRWQAEVNGRYVDLDRVWPACATDPISQDEHDHLMGLQTWAETHAPDSAIANPNRKLDLLTAPLVF